MASWAPVASPKGTLRTATFYQMVVGYQRAGTKCMEKAFHL
jgi:hypothetical protein